jgi:hypothetical protein
MTDVRHAIVQAIHAHMPSAAVASGWASPVDPKPWVDRVSRLIPFVDRPDDMGLTALTDWLNGMGFEAGASFIRALREAWIRDALAVESRRLPVRIFACTRKKEV